MRESICFCFGQSEEKPIKDVFVTNSAIRQIHEYRIIIVSSRSFYKYMTQLKCMFSLKMWTNKAKIKLKLGKSKKAETTMNMEKWTKMNVG